jgi:hypothetical protein
MGLGLPVWRIVSRDCASGLRHHRMNATDGFLSKDQTGLERLDLKDNPILSPAVHYFHVPSPDRVYDT